MSEKTPSTSNKPILCYICLREHPQRICTSCITPDCVNVQHNCLNEVQRTLFQLIDAIPQSELQPKPLKSRKCFYCNKTPKKLKKKQLLICSRCKRVEYCSQKCQKADWNAGHKTGCMQEFWAGVGKSYVETVRLTLIKTLEKVNTEKHLDNGHSDVYQLVYMCHSFIGRVMNMKHENSDKRMSGVAKLTNHVQKAKMIMKYNSMDTRFLQVLNDVYLMLYNYSFLQLRNFGFPVVENMFSNEDFLCMECLKLVKGDRQGYFYRCLWCQFIACDTCFGKIIVNQKRVPVELCLVKETNVDRVVLAFMGLTVVKDINGVRAAASSLVNYVVCDFLYRKYSGVKNLPKQSHFVEHDKVVDWLQRSKQGDSAMRDHEILRMNHEKFVDDTFGKICKVEEFGELIEKFKCGDGFDPMYIHPLLSYYFRRKIDVREVALKLRSEFATVLLLKNNDDDESKKRKKKKKSGEKTKTGKKKKKKKKKKKITKVQKQPDPPKKTYYEKEREAEEVEFQVKVLHFLSLIEDNQKTLGTQITTNFNKIVSAQHEFTASSTNDENDEVEHTTKLYNMQRDIVVGELSKVNRGIVSRLHHLERKMNFMLDREMSAILESEVWLNSGRYYPEYNFHKYRIAKIPDSTWTQISQFRNLREWNEKARMFPKHKMEKILFTTRAVDLPFLGTHKGGRKQKILFDLDVGDFERFDGVKSAQSKKRPSYASVNSLFHLMVIERQLMYWYLYRELFDDKRHDIDIQEKRRISRIVASDLPDSVVVPKGVVIETINEDDLAIYGSGVWFPPKPQKSESVKKIMRKPKIPIWEVPTPEGVDEIAEFGFFVHSDDENLRYDEYHRLIDEQRNELLPICYHLRGKFRLMAICRFKTIQVDVSEDKEEDDEE